jgi:hypothetical protein
MGSMSDRPSHAPRFVASHDEPEPGVSSAGRFPDGSLPVRPGPEPTRTREEARAKGLAAPEDPAFFGAERRQDGRNRLGWIGSTGQRGVSGSGGRGILPQLPFRVVLSSLPSRSRKPFQRGERL